MQIFPSPLSKPITTDQLSFPTTTTDDGNSDQGQSEVLRFFILWTGIILPAPSPITLALTLTSLTQGQRNASNTQYNQSQVTTVQQSVNTEKGECNKPIGKRQTNGSIIWGNRLTVLRKGIGVTEVRYFDALLDWSLQTWGRIDKTQRIIWTWRSLPVIVAEPECVRRRWKLIIMRHVKIVQRHINFATYPDDDNFYLRTNITPPAAWQYCSVSWITSLSLIHNPSPSVDLVIRVEAASCKLGRIYLWRTTYVPLRKSLSTNPDSRRGREHGSQILPPGDVDVRLQLGTWEHRYESQFLTFHTENTTSTHPQGGGAWSRG